VFGLLKRTFGDAGSRRNDGVGRQEHWISGARKPVTTAQTASLYNRPPSFADLLPWVDFDDESKVFLLEDWRGVAALFELTPVPSEGRTEGYMERLSESLQTVIADSIPEEDTAPWVLQFFVQDDHDLSGYLADLEAYIRERNPDPDNALSAEFLDLMKEHVARLSNPNGIFVDGAVTGCRWHARNRRVRAALYRRPPRGSVSRSGAPTPEAELGEVAQRFVAALSSSGVSARRCDERDLYEWLFPWFNPAPKVARGGRGLDYAPYPGSGDRSLGMDLASLLLLSPPSSDAREGAWFFDGLPHKCLTVDGLRSAPRPGHLTGERRAGEHINALFDLMPEHTIMGMTVVIQAQDQIRNKIASIKNASRVDTATANAAREQCETAEVELARGNKLYPVTLCFFLRGSDIVNLRQKTTQVTAALLSQGLQPIEREADLLALDSYIRMLPMNYDPAHDRKTKRSRLLYASQIASLAPFYGRSTGTGHPGWSFWNRGGEPLTFDPLNKMDRSKNAFALIVGPMGSGKSAFLCYSVSQMAAIYRPRIFIIEKGDSFGLLGRYLASRGLSVNQVTLKPGVEISLNPFADAVKLLDDALRSEAMVENFDDAVVPEEDDTEEEKERDILGEMEIAARIMITGGEKKEDDRMTRADRMLIRRAILEAARTVASAGRDQAIPEDLVAAMRALAKDPELFDTRRNRVQEMADGMELFCDGLAGRFFNRPGKPWPDSDVTIVDMGIFANEGYEDLLAVAYIGLMNRINAVVEARQYEHRHTLVVTDEGHLITTNPLLAPYVIKIVKMWRKLGAWFWIATQNLEDFPAESRKMLTTMEWWICLTMTKDEVEQVARFKELTDEQKKLLVSATKSPGRYTEGAVLADNVNALFRNIPPPFALALAMTEKHEKAERAQIMAETGCSEVEAALIVADRIAARSTGARP